MTQYPTQSHYPDTELTSPCQYFFMAQYHTRLQQPSGLQVWLNWSLNSNLKPLSHFTGLAKQMETKQSPMKYMNVHFYMVIIQPIHSVSVPCSLTFNKCFVPFHAWKTTVKNICCPVLPIISIKYGVARALTHEASSFKDSATGSHMVTTRIAVAHYTATVLG